jgi:hypothetical protein
MATRPKGVAAARSIVHDDEARDEPAIGAIR